MQISPKFSMYLNVVVALVSALAMMSPSMFPSYIPVGIATNVIQTCGFLGTLYGTINAALHGMSAPSAGPLAGKVDPAKAASLAVIGLLVIGMGGLSGCANLTPQQQANLQLELALAKQFGTDAVQVWCAASGIIYVIADAETGHKASPDKAVTFLANNANAAAAACPMLAQVTGVQAVASVPVGATASPITAAAQTVKVN